jgi:hypothetical protein
MIRKFILTTALAVASVNVSASTSEWNRNEAGGAYVFDSQAGSNLYAYMEPNSGGVITVYFAFGHNSCHDVEYEVTPIGNITVNGQEVRARYQCSGKGRAIVDAKTVRGNRFIVNEFKIKNFVYITVGSNLLRFSAKGFTREFNGLTSRENAL